MKKLSVFMLTILVSASAFAQRGGMRSSGDFSSSGSGNSATGYIGFGETALNVGGDFTAAMTNDTGVGGYFFFLTEKENNGATVRPQIITFGGQAKASYRPSSWDLYLAPGFGIAMVEAGNNDETTFGPSMRIGALYNLTSQLAVGLEHATFFNWFSDEMGAGDFETANVAFRMNF